ncbi:MAG: twin-arginine translocase TatA/TatE family subunit [Solirubrobacteraceae bacterium]
MVGDILQPTHLLFVLVIALLVLGPKRLPEVAKTLGKGIRDFRGAISGDSDHPDPTPSYLTGDSTPGHDESPAPAPAHEAPAPVGETPAPTSTPAPPAAAAPQPVQPVDEPVQPIATPATIAPPPPASPPQPAPAERDDTQTHPAASSAERHE